ncbi:SAM-dependent methyltransferase [Saccharothrix syringae]|uniref:Class I SAM-dependent methyltransferase n=1 Tax=Saccharothrix syringae TaxID=103733 RepID=A0A5Q0H602_SACSY|nr:SAM-dependent methyltransferase [Saccharothrix syringae]QFZ21364.1 class I SAM-dependent methyltransferase [Saccharothrix syringae]
MRSESTLPQLSHTLDGAVSAIPSFVFDPTDPWTTTFQAGLERAGLNGRRVYEVGIGTGTNVAFMLRRCSASLVLGSDLDPRLPALAQRFVGEAEPDLLDRFRPIDGSVNLIDTPVARAEVALADVVVGCLPQVPDPEDAMYARFHTAQLKIVVRPGQRTDDHIAHYYPWTAFNEYPFNTVGLGLIEALLRSTKAYAPKAEVVLMFACRVGKEALLRLFRANGYRPEQLASRIIRQNARTDISFFVALEAAMRGTGFERDFVCEFYADPDGEVPISATTARDLSAQDPTVPVYHEVCVLRGHPEQQ